MTQDEQKPILDRVVDGIDPRGTPEEPKPDPALAIQVLDICGVLFTNEQLVPASAFYGLRPWMQALTAAVRQGVLPRYNPDAPWGDGSRSRAIREFSAWAQAWEREHFDNDLAALVWPSAGKSEDAPREDPLPNGEDDDPGPDCAA